MRQFQSVFLLPVVMKIVGPTHLCCCMPFPFKEELERMRTILTMVSGEAKMPDGEELQQGSRYSSAGEEDN